MAIQSQPSRIPEPFAGSGTKNTIPATNTTPSASQAASWASGFPPECSQPISAGGCPVPRNDVNGALNQLSQDFAFRQDGGIWEWSALADYDAQRVVRGSDGLLYYSVQPSGPGIAAGAQDPTTDAVRAYWASPGVPTMPATDVSASAASTKFVDDKISLEKSPAEFYWDAVSGDDANDGLTPATAVKTSAGLRTATMNYIRPTGYEITVHVAAGTYTDSLSTLYGQVSILYDLASGVTFKGANTTQPGVRLMISGGPAITTGSIEVSGQSQVYVVGGLNLTFNTGSSVSSAFQASFGGLISQINASSSNKVYINFSNCTFSTATVYSNDCGIVRLNNVAVQFSGTVTGKRYAVSNNSVISGAGSTTFYPGTVNGTTDTSSAYH